MTQCNQSNAHVVVRFFEMSPMEDSNSPFYLHNEGYPGLILILQPFNGRNYNTWSRMMMMALTTKNKVGFIDGTIPRVTANNLLFNAWTCCNSMVISWLLNFVSKEIMNRLMYIATTCKIWNDLKDRFRQSNGPHIFQLKKHPITLEQGALNINTYYTCFKILWEELKNFQSLLACHCGGMQVWLEYQQ